MNWIAPVARHIGLMAAACALAAAIAGILVFLVEIVFKGNQAELDPLFFLMYALWGYLYFVFLFVFPLLPVLWGAIRLGLAAKLTSVLLTPVYATFVTTPLSLVSENPINTFYNVSGLAGAR